MYFVTIGSKSELKKKAVINACMRTGHDFEVTTLDVPSGVPAQPYGDLETTQGATNRAKHAVSMRPGSWGIGIENGLFQHGDRWIDIAVVIVRSPSGVNSVWWSAGVEMPADAIALAEKRGIGKVTVGSIIAELHGCAPDDPHSFLTGGEKNRLQILTDAVEIVLGDVWASSKKEET